MTVLEFVKHVAAEFGLTIDDGDAGFVLWNHTGFPCFFRDDGTYEQVLRPQLEAVFVDWAWR